MARQNQMDITQLPLDQLKKLKDQVEEVSHPHHSLPTLDPISL